MIVWFWVTINNDIESLLHFVEAPLR